MHESRDNSCGSISSVVYTQSYVRNKTILTTHIENNKTRYYIFIFTNNIRNSMLFIYILLLT